MSATPEGTVKSTGASAGDVLVGVHSSNNSGLLIEVSSAQPIGKGGRIAGSFRVLSEGSGKYAAGIRAVIAHKSRFDRASDFIQQVSRQKGCHDCTHILNANALRKNINLVSELTLPRIATPTISFPQTKQCPLCFRSYDDVSLNFCLDDGSFLSSSFNGSTPTDSSEIETIVHSPQKLFSGGRDSRKAFSDSWGDEKTEGTEEKRPTRTSVVTSARPITKWTSADFVREITFQITSTHTFHSQENLEILREFFNKHISDPSRHFNRSAWQNGKARFETYKGVLTYDFQKQSEPSANGLLLEVLKFVTGKEKSIQIPKVVVGKKASRINYDFIRAVVSSYPNLKLITSRESNFIIRKHGRTGSIWLVPQEGGLSITANGPNAKLLYVEMEKLFGCNYREDAKGHRYFQVNGPKEVEVVIENWAAI